MYLAQRYNTATCVSIEPTTSHSGDRRSTTRPTRLPGCGSVMIFLFIFFFFFGGGGGVSLNTKTAPVFVRGNLNAARYQTEILLPVCIPHLRNNKGIYMMQVDATSHSASTTQNILQTHRVNVLPWPSKSPYLNPIEHIWDVISRSVRRRGSANIRQLQQFVMDAWNSIAQRTCLSYVDSMRSRCQAVIQANGGHTRY